MDTNLVPKKIRKEKKQGLLESNHTQKLCVMFVDGSVQTFYFNEWMTYVGGNVKHKIKFDIRLVHKGQIFNLKR